MAIQDGFKRFACDVGGCGSVNYDRDGGAYAARYVTKAWIDSNGIERSATFCKDHVAKFNAIMEDHSKELDAFLKDGTVPSRITTTTATK